MARVRPLIVRVMVPLVRIGWRTDRGEIARIATGLVPLVSVMGSGVIVTSAAGMATPLMVIVAGSMSVWALNAGLVLLKMKMFNGVVWVRLTVFGCPVAELTPIWTVTPVFCGV